jgi:GTP-binding protein Era
MEVKMTENIEKDLLQRSAEETEAAAGQENEQAACRQEGQAAGQEEGQAAGQETESAADRGTEPDAGEQEPSAPVLKKAGFATIIGRPNVGKSTLMNRMIGQKIAITSYKPQTTRTRIRTIYTGEEGQIVFLDTPGIHQSRTKLGTYMVKAAKGTLKEVDVILWLVEPRQKISEEDKLIIELLKEVKTPVIVVINKIDKVKKAEILPVIDEFARLGVFHEIIPVSARTGDGVDRLMKDIFDLMPVGQPFYDEDMVTTQTEREIAGEIVREKALRLLQEEVPHGIAVTIESMKMRSRKGKGEICDIDASIICEREGHKRIVIGKGGEMLRRIGTDARKDIENMLQCQVNLKLWVKVRRDWKDDDTQMRSFGYDDRKL